MYISEYEQKLHGNKGPVVPWQNQDGRFSNNRNTASDERSKQMRYQAQEIFNYLLTVDQLKKS